MTPRPTPALARLLLRALSVGFVWPLFVNLVFGRVAAVLGCAVGIGLLWLAARLIAEGLEQGAAAARNGGVAEVRPLKRAGIAAVGAAAAAISLGAASYAWPMALVMALLAGWGAWAVVGDDPRLDRRTIDERARRAGLRPADLASALADARAKITAIETAAAQLVNIELRARTARIVTLARRVLARIEAEPRQLERARRFLVTYLDGTRDVVASYAAQEHDLAASPLATNFRRVLGTVETVFTEQLDRLQEDRQLDLEVQIEVLETQLVHEGVH